MSKSKSITDLYKEFERAVAAKNALPQLPIGALDDPDFDRAVEKCGKIAWQIVKAPAQSMSEVQLKIAIAGWRLGARDKDLTELQHWQPDGLYEHEDAYALATLRDDLRRLQAQ